MAIEEFHGISNINPASTLQSFYLRGNGCERLERDLRMVLQCSPSAQAGKRSVCTNLEQWMMDIFAYSLFSPP